MERIKKLKEFWAVAAIITCLIALQWRLWITHEWTVSHDSIIWFGLFSYFVEFLQRGVFPFWNPYMNCGEPFFLNINSLHLLDPSTLFLIFIGKLFKTDIFLLYHYDLLLRYVIFIMGSYCFFRHVAKYKISALIATIVITFSSLGVTYLRQHGYLLPFYLAPWILLSILKIIEHGPTKSLIGLALLLGVMLPSYHSMYPIVFFVILLASLVLTGGLSRPQWKIARRDYKVIFASIFILFLLVINFLPVYLKYVREVIPTLRIFEAPLAANASPADFLNLLIPDSFIFHFFTSHNLYMSDTFLYIGLLPLLFAVLGLYFSSHRYKWGFLMTLVVIGLLMLGRRSFVYPFFDRFFPAFSIIRNMSTFAFAFIFCLVYFTCIGVDSVFEAIHTGKIKTYEKPIAFIAFFILALALLMDYHLQTITGSIVTTYNILAGYPLPNTAESAQLLNNAFAEIIMNLSLFCISVSVVILSLKNSRIRLGIKSFVIVSFILADLAFFNLSVFKYVTKDKSAISFPVANPYVYNDFRIAVHQPQYPFYAFAPAMLKIDTAYSTKIPWVTTHFYETKDFYEFINDREIPDSIKNVWMGISALKLRLVHQGISLPRHELIEELKKIDENTARRVVFVEEELPYEYSHLILKSFSSIRSVDLQRKGDVEVLSFNPNEIVLKVHSDEDSFLYYSDGFDKDWRVFVDGKEGTVYKTNLAFKSTIVEKGEHSVHFIYDPKFYKFGLLCYFAGLLIAIVLILNRGFFKAKEDCCAENR